LIRIDSLRFWYRYRIDTAYQRIKIKPIVCLLQGASKPPIIRLCKDHFAVVVIAATPLNESGSFGRLEFSKSILHFQRDVLLVWDWEKLLGESQDQEEYETLIKTPSQVPEHSKAELGDHLDKSTRTWNVAVVLGDLERYEKAEERLPEAIEMAFGTEHLHTLKSQHGLTPLSWAAGNGYDTVVAQLMAKDSVNLDLKDSHFSRTPLLWAAWNGHEGIVKLSVLSSDTVVITAVNRPYCTTSCKYRTTEKLQPCKAVLQLCVCSEKVQKPR
jgi:hypothetical protein